MKKILLLLVAVLTSVFAMAQKADYTSVSLNATEINLDDETASIGLLVDGDLDEMNQMYAQFGMVSNILNNAYLYEGDDAEGVKLDAVQVAWGKPINFIKDMSTLKYDTTYKLVIEVGGLSTMSYMTMGNLFENNEKITLTFKTLAGRTDPFIKSAKFNVQNYQTVNLDDSTFTGIKLAVKAMNLPTVGAYLIYQGGVRLYDLDDPEGKYTFCNVTDVAISSEEIILCPKEKLAKGKNYKVVIPFESLYVHNYFDMFKEVCYFDVDSVEFYTEYEAPTADIDATCKIGSENVTITNANAEQNTFVYILDNSYLNAGQTAEEYAIKQLNYANASMLNKGTFDAPYNQFLWGMYEGEYSVVIMGAEYDATREACYATTKPMTVLFSVDENGNVIGAEPAEIAVTLVAADSLQTEYALNTHSTVTIDQAIAAIKVSGLDQTLDSVTYAIYDMQKATLASGLLSVNTIGYAEFAPVTLYEGNQYNVVIANKNSALYDVIVIGAVEPEIIEIAATINDSIALNTKTAVSAESIAKFEVTFDGIVPTQAGYSINSLKEVVGDSTSTWEINETLAQGELSLSGKGYAELEEVITLNKGTKYSLIITYAAGSVNDEVIFVIDGAYDDANAINAIAADAAANGKYLENGKVVIVKAGVKYNAAGQIIK